MGTRWLEVDVRVLVDFLKAHDGARRSYSVEYPLPDDARVWTPSKVRLELRSDTWEEDLTGERFLRPPVVHLHLQEQPEGTGG